MNRWTLEPLFSVVYILLLATGVLAVTLAAAGLDFALVVVTALPAEDDLDKQLDKLRNSIPFTAYEEKYANGQIEERGRMRFLGYVCGQAWTEYDGLREGWYASGAKECEMSYKNGKRDGVALNWTAAADTVVGYNVYRSAAHTGPYIRLNGTPINGIVAACSPRALRHRAR